MRGNSTGGDVRKQLSYSLLSCVQFKTGQREITQVSVDKSTFRSLKDKYFAYGHCGVEKSLNLQVRVTNFNTESNICHVMTMGVKLSKDEDEATLSSF